MFRRDRQDRDGGGILMYVKNSIFAKIRPDLSINSLETLWIELELPKSKPFILGVVYRPPNSLQSWIDLFEEEFESAHSENKEIILMGDFNIDLIKNENKKWSNFIDNVNLTQMVHSPTRICESSETLIDHIYTTNPENLTNCHVPVYAISDHYPICLNRRIHNKAKKDNHIEIKYRCFKRFNEDNFISDLSNSPFNLIELEEDVNIAMEKWYDLFERVLDKHAPIRNKRVKSYKQAEWFNDSIKTAINNRNNCHSRKDWENFKHWRNKTTSLINKSKENYYQNAISNSENSKVLWRHLKDLNPSLENIFPPKIEYENETFHNAQDIVNTLNNHFSTVADKLVGEYTPDMDFTVLQTYISDKRNISENFKVGYISVAEVHKQLRLLNVNKSSGLDYIGPKILRLSADVIAPSLTFLINKSISSGRFPNKLKHARVTAIHKSGSTSIPSNYRPISVLCTISKLFERHVSSRLYMTS